jgi:hypothetical protein
MVGHTDFFPDREGYNSVGLSTGRGSVELAERWCGLTSFYNHLSLIRSQLLRMEAPLVGHFYNVP